MNRCCSRVASLPTRTSRSPVAKGSSVPAWPTLVPRGYSRRTVATMSCEVFPAGLSMRRMPSLRAASELRRDLFAQEVHERLELELGGEPGRLAVPAPALRTGDGGDVDLAVG